MIQPQTFLKEEVCHAPVEKVWQAITDKDAMKAWYFDIPDFELKEGATFNFYEPGEAKQYHHRCTIKEIVLLQKLQHTWTHPSHSKGITLLTWELSPQGDETLIRLTHSGLETFADGGPAFAKENYEAGWNEIIGNNLKIFVEK